MSLVSLLQVGFGIWAFFTLLFVIAYLKRDISFIDIGWGPGFSILFLLIIVIQDYAISSLQLSQCIIVALWSLRLFTYLYMRNKSKGEDRRYQELAKNWKGSRWANAYFRVYTVQAILLLIVGTPLLVAPGLNPSTYYLVIGAVVALIGLVIESLADWQMQKFQKLKTRTTKFCRLGLWQFSRHPNYFGEMVFWFGIAAMTGSFLSFIGPIFLTFLLLKVSGIPMIENKYKTHPEWAQYERETRLLLPLPKQG